MATVAPAPSLDDKYLLREGRIFLSGVQALVRVPLDQHRADAAAGLRTGTFVSGYQGSPLGTFDKELQRNRALCEEHDLVLQPGVNEELGATAVWGSQLVPSIKGAKVDGVVGYWYGKNPGLDRAADAIRHANLCGVGPTGGAVALVGDDPSCKSSTLPSASEPMLASLLLPILWPGNVQEVLDLGRHAVALSRASGLWTGFKVVTNVADAAGTAEVSPDRVVPVLPEVLRGGKPYRHKPNPVMLAPDSLISERNLFDVRLEIARAYSRLNGLNRVTVDGPGAWLGIAASGKTYADLIQAFSDLGLDERALKAAGIRVLKIAMPWPLETQTVREWGEGLEELLVVEDKLPFLETAIKDAMYGVSEPPRVVGKRDEEGRILLPAEGELDADLIARAVAGRLKLRGIRVESVVARMEQLEQAQRAKLVPLPVVRTPFFCSGCPHNSSTVAADDALVGAGIGCHTMVLLNRDGRGTITGITQMGGEGAQWIGMSPWVEQEHFVQNLGDGTFHHSGSLAVRASVAAGTNVTYKLFANGTVAMTGAQPIEGQMSVADLTRWFALEGVKRIVVTDGGRGALRRRGALPDRLAAPARGPPRGAGGAREGRGRDRPHPRPGLRRGEPPAAQAREARRAGAARRHQRARLRGLRGLRREELLPQRPARRDGVRAQDADPPGLVQQGLLLPRGRLPLVPHGDPRQAGEARDAGAARRTSRSRRSSSTPRTSRCG